MYEPLLKTISPKFKMVAIIYMELGHCKKKLMCSPIEIKNKKTT